MYLAVYKKNKDKPKSKWTLASNPTKSLQAALDFSEKLKKDAIKNGLDVQVSIQSFAILNEIPETLVDVKSEKLLLN